MYNFDSLANAYTKNTKAIPEDYTSFINKLFQINIKDNVIDLGCGSGEIALFLAKTGARVTGIDISKKMISLAKSQDAEKKVVWRIGDVNRFKFNKNHYKLIFSYETFHLFSNTEKLLNKVAKSLNSDGYFGIGYCIYNWEEKLYKDILEILLDNHIYIKDWFFQKPNNINNLIYHNTHSMLSAPLIKYVSVNETWTAQEIADFVTSTSIFLNINVDVKKIKQELLFMINKKHGNLFTGETKYYICYSKKIITSHPLKGITQRKDKQWTKNNLSK